jgi:hypothetical protein
VIGPANARPTTNSNATIAGASAEPELAIELRLMPHGRVLVISVGSEHRILTGEGWKSLEPFLDDEPDVADVAAPGAKEG